MPAYRITAGKLTVRARSRIHDTTTVWDKISGEVEADPETLATAGAKATFRVDMTSFDAGDWLRNRKLRKDFALEAHPEATFELRALRDVVRDGAAFTATAVGALRWRGREVEVTLAGRGTLDAAGLEASATFELDIRKLGLSAPRFLVIKMEDEVSIEVTVHGPVRA
ncbi:MAG TPA: YceI family protein [Kofleriaceae bacterium]|nr:YceI family protein [Kofleriaceae bacterium]